MRRGCEGASAPAGTEDEARSEMGSARLRGAGRRGGLGWKDDCSESCWGLINMRTPQTNEEVILKFIGCHIRQYYQPFVPAWKIRFEQSTSNILSL